MRTVLTYGTFDLFHVGHVRLLERARALGDRLIVGVSTDEFNALKNKKSVFSHRDRMEIVRACQYVDNVIEEQTWVQKRTDIVKYDVSVFVMGDDWAGKFDHLGDICEVVYLSRTGGISTTQIRHGLAPVADWPAAGGGAVPAAGRALPEAGYGSPGSEAPSGAPVGGV